MMVALTLCTQAVERDDLHLARVAWRGSAQDEYMFDVLLWFSEDATPSISSTGSNST